MGLQYMQNTLFSYIYIGKIYIYIFIYTHAFKMDGIQSKSVVNSTASLQPQSSWIDSPSRQNIRSLNQLLKRILSEKKPILMC